jgi:hypothetical protein
MFQSFVTGPIGAQGLGLIGRCVRCRARNAQGQAPCAGFGSGCLSRPREEERIRLGFSYAPLLDIDPRLGGF